MTPVGWVFFVLALGTCYVLGILTVGLCGRREQEFTTMRCRECGRILGIRSDGEVANEWCGPCGECGEKAES